jgi:hypothetical protein
MKNTEFASRVHITMYSSVVENKLYICKRIAPVLVTYSTFYRAVNLTHVLQL